MFYWVDSFKDFNSKNREYIAALYPTIILNSAIWAFVFGIFAYEETNPDMAKPEIRYYQEVLDCAVEEIQKFHVLSVLSLLSMCTISAVFVPICLKRWYIIEVIC